MAVISDIDRRVIQWDCTQLIYRFYACLDEHNYDELATLFAPTGAWVRLGKELVGPAGILEGIRERENWLTAHLVTNVRIQVVGVDVARSSQFVTLYRHENWDLNSGPAPVVLPLGVLRHQDELVRFDGRWMFQRKTSRAVMVDRDRVTHYETS
jgi:hypothetical protein